MAWDIERDGERRHIDHEMIREVVADVVKEQSRGMVVAPTNGARLRFYSTVAGLFMACSTIGGFVATLWVDSKIHEKIADHEKDATERMAVVASEYVKKGDLIGMLSPMQADDKVTESRYQEILRRLDGIESEVRRLREGR